MPVLKNKRHEAFVKEYRANGFNALQAYKKVYKCSDRVAQSNGVKLLANTRIKARLEELGKKDQLKYGIKVESLVYDLKKIKERGIKEYSIYNEDGDEVGGKPTDLNASLKAIDMLIKIVGGYAPTKTENKNENHNLEINWVEEIDEDQ